MSDEVSRHTAVWNKLNEPHRITLVVGTAIAIASLLRAAKRPAPTPTTKPDRGWHEIPLSEYGLLPCEDESHQPGLSYE